MARFSKYHGEGLEDDYAAGMVRQSFRATYYSARAAAVTRHISGEVKFARQSTTGEIVVILKSEAPPPPTQPTTNPHRRVRLFFLLAALRFAHIKSSRCI